MQDAPLAGELLCATMGESGVLVLGNGDRERTLTVLRTYFIGQRHRFSYEYCWMAELNGRVAGLLLGFPGREISHLDAALAGPTLGLYGLRGLARLLWRSWPLVGHREAELDEFYIAHLATLPDFRCRGVGGALLAHAERLCREAGLEKCSLMVDLENENARRLYEARGYRAVETVSTEFIRRRLRFKGYARMVKPL